MENQITSNENAMRLFFTEDIFLVKDDGVLVPSDLAENSVKANGENQSQAPKISDLIPKQEPVKREIPVLETYTAKVESLPVVEEPVLAKPFKHLGGNNKSVLILVHDEQNEVSTEEGRLLLRNIVKAINLSTADFALVNYAHYKGTDFSALHDYFKPALMLAFGVGSADLKLDLARANEIILYQTTRMIFAPNLHQLDGDIATKKALWGNLKKV